MHTVSFDDQYYTNLIREYGYDPLTFSRINFSIGALSKEDLQRRWLCHDNADTIANGLKNGKKVIMSTGFGLSGKPHIGTLSQIFRSINLQHAGVPVNLVLGDLDAYNGKGIPLSQTQELAQMYETFILALGFKMNDGSILRTQFEALEVLRLAYIIAHFMSDDMFDNAEEDLHDLYVMKNKVDKGMTYRRKLSLNLMTSDFLHLHTTMGYEHIMVMLGVDEHKYVRFAHETINKIKQSENSPVNLVDLKLSALYTPLIKGFFDYPKMSKSFPDSGITVDLSADEIRRRIVEGEGSFDKPENNVVYQMMAGVSTYTSSELKTSYNECLENGPAWMKRKKEYTEMLIDICSKWPHD